MFVLADGRKVDVTHGWGYEGRDNRGGEGLDFPGLKQRNRGQSGPDIR
jgi:hypothetical protein